MAHSSSALEKYPLYEATIGIEVHVQLTTNSKIFCACPNTMNAGANENICQVCTGMPGTLPLFNQKVLDHAIALGIGTKSDIASTCTFDRKHYFYPDLPKGYQITQQYHPICTNGVVPIRLEDGRIKEIRLIRIHIEEDAGKNIHSPTSNESFVDLNRAGVPLLEVVSQPDISNAYEAKAYLKALRNMVMYLGICSGNMEEGAFRADTNISVRKKGATQLGTKCELKNINSFKFIGDAIEYEIERQIELLEKEERVKQETRLWDTKRQCTVVMRTKEEAADYRYFQDPDLPLLHIDTQHIAAVRTTMPELPFDRTTRYVSSGLSQAEADILVDDPTLGNYFDTARTMTDNKQLINWVLRDIRAYIKETGVAIDSSEFPIAPEYIAALVNMIQEGKLNSNTAKQVFNEIITTKKHPKEIAELHGFGASMSDAELKEIITQVLAGLSKEVEQYKTTKNERMVGLFVGKIMQRVAGKANPIKINELLKEQLQ